MASSIDEMDPAAKARLADDILSIITQAGGTECVSGVLDGIRGGHRGPYSPESGRRWRGISHLSDFEYMCRQLGFTVQEGRNGRNQRRVEVTL